MRTSTIGRRRFLGGLGAGAMLAPLVGSLARAGEIGPAPRLLVFFTPNEPIAREHWHPGGAGNEFALDMPLRPMMQSLDPFRADMLMIGDMKMRTRDLDNFGGGHVGMGHMLTGHINVPYGEQNYEFWAGGISVDQHIANALDCDALTLAVSPGGNSGNGRMSYSGRNQPVHPTTRPDDAFDALFADALLPADELALLRARRLSVLDRVVGDLEKAKARVSASDRDKIDAHLQRARDLEVQLAQDTTLQCEPVAPAAADYGSNAMIPVTIRRQIDVAVEALACGVTQVASLQIGNTGADHITPIWPDHGINVNTGLHTNAHDYVQNPSAQATTQRVAVETFFFEQFAYLLQQLRDRPDAGGGTLLDNTLVFWTKSLGRDHRGDELLYILAGGSNLGLQTGRYIGRTDVPHNNLLVSVCNLMGLPDETFGDPNICTGAVDL